MKTLLQYLRPYRKECVWGPLLKLAEATLELFIPLLVAAIIDRGIAKEDRTLTVQICLLMGLLGLLGLLFSVTAQYVSAKAAVGFAARLRQALFQHIQKLSFRTLDEVGTPTLINRLTSDVNQVQTGVNLTLRLLLRSPFVVFGAMIMAFSLDVKGALVFAVIIPLLGVTVFGIMLPCIPLYKRAQNNLDALLARTRENLAGVRVIRAFCKEPQEQAAFDEDNSALTASQLFVGRISALLNPLTYVLLNAAVLLLLWTGAIRVEHGLITQGVVVALYNYMSQILVELIKLANLIINVTKAVAGGNRLVAVLALPVAQDAAEAPTPQPDAPRVEFRGVTLQYHPDSQPALTDISLQIPAGEIFGIIGGTSAGKTSLANLIPRFYTPTSGLVLVDGVDVQALPAASLRRRMGLVPQQPTLFSGSVRENLHWGNGEATDDELWEALRAAQAEEFIRNKENGLDFPIEQGGRNLSGGQRQRLTIARALVRKPDILLLDDSSSALDFATEAALRQSLRQLPWQPTVLIISQRISAVREAHRIAVLADGSLAGVGSHHALLADCAEYRAMVAAQTREEVPHG